jgi:alpha-amylase
MPNITLRVYRRKGDFNPIHHGMTSRHGWICLVERYFFYEIFVRSFYDSDGNGIGDFNGLIAKLDYLNDGDPKTASDFGITCQCLIPVNPAASYHGYDPTDYYVVNPDYRVMDDFSRLLQECHKWGIRVIIDMVYKHTYTKHPRFIESRDQPQSAKRDWCVWSSTNPGYLGPWGEQVWYITISGYYYAIFWIGQPDLNHTNQVVTDEMYNVAKYWLQDIGVDGFRLDAARYLIEDGKDHQDTPETLTWWSNFRTFYKGINPQAIKVAEVYTTNYIVENYLKENDFDQASDFDLASRILKNIDGRNAVNLNASIKSSFQLFPKGEYAIFLSNYDQESVMRFFSGDQVKTKLVASVLLTIPGTPFICHGDEIGMTGNKPGERIHTPMLWSVDKYAGFSTVIPWESINCNYVQNNVATEINDPNSLLSWYRDLIQLRNNHAALRVGDYYMVRSDDFSIMPFLRVSKEETLLVILNMSEKPASGFTLTLDKGPLIGNYHAYMVLGEGNVKRVKSNQHGGFDGYKPLSKIPANGLVIIQLR